MKANKKKILIIILSIIAVIATVSVLPIKTNFIFANDEERRQIDEFYGFQPEMISEGNFYDLKLLTPYTMMPEGVSGGYSMWISVVRKIESSIRFTMDIEYFYQGKKVDMDAYYYNDTKFEDIFYLRTMAVTKVNRYCHPNFIITFLPTDVDDVIRIDELKITISYFWGKEVHNLKFDADSSENLVNDVMRAHIENPNTNYKYVRSYYSNFYESLQMYDFERWYTSVDRIVDKCANERDELSCYVVENVLLETLSPQQVEVLLSSEQAVRLQDLITKRRNIRNVLRVE